jgi:hypothetical protein
MHRVGVVEVDRERLFLANCVACGSTLSVEIRRFSSSGNWRAVTLPDVLP